MTLASMVTIANAQVPLGWQAHLRSAATPELLKSSVREAWDAWAENVANTPPAPATSPVGGGQVVFGPPTIPGLDPVEVRNVEGRPDSTSFWDWMQYHVVDRVRVSGYRVIGVHAHSVDGDRDAFNASNYGGLNGGVITDMGHLVVRGDRVLGGISFDFSIQDNRFRDPQGQEFRINYDTGPFRVQAGDLRTTFGTNSFANVQRLMRGLVFEYSQSDFTIRALQSESRGEPRSVSLLGNNTAGPYYLQSSQVVRGSERIEVDGVPQVLGRDYVINYEAGAIEFVNRETGEAKLIPPTSTITAFYESLGFGQRGGTLQGLHAGVNLGAVGTLNATFLQQREGGGGALSSRLERFQGFGPAGTPYILQFEPLRSQPVVVRVDGVLQVEGFDYFFDAERPAIFYFNRFVPTTSDVDVLYTPVPVGGRGGNREAIGLDWRLPLGVNGRRGFVSWQGASGRETGGTGASGVAQSTQVRYEEGPFLVTGSWRNVPQGFSGVDTLGAPRAEQGWESRLQYRASDRLTAGVGHRNSSISLRDTTRQDGLSINNRWVTSQFFVDYTPLGMNNPIRADHSRSNTFTANGETSLVRTELGTRHRFGALEASLNLTRQEAEGPVFGSGGTSRRASTINTVGSTLRYLVNREWTTFLNASFSDVSSGGERGTGREIAGGLTFTPTHSPFSMAVRYTDSDSGPLATLGQFESGFGLGFGSTGGNAFTGATTVRQLQVNANMRPQGGQWSATAYFNRSLFSGSVSSNTETTAYGITGGMRLGSWINLALNLDLSSTSFLGSANSSNATTFNMFLDGNPAERWSYRAGLSMLVSGGNSPFRQNSTAYDLSVSYLLADRQALSLQTRSGNTRGYLPQAQSDLRLVYSYRIWESLALNLSYRIQDIRNLDPSITSGAYRANGFDFELAFDFFR